MHRRPAKYTAIYSFVIGAALATSNVVNEVNRRPDRDETDSDLLVRGPLPRGIVLV